MAAATAPSGNVFTTARSPASASPGFARLAWCHSKNGGSPTSATSPLLDHHSRALAGLGVDLELVHEPSGAGQAHAQAPPGGESFVGRCIDIDDPGTFVPGHDHDGVPAVLEDVAQVYLADARVGEDVAGKLRDSGGDERGVGSGEPQLPGELPPLLPGDNQIRVGLDGDEVLICHC